MPNTLEERDWKLLLGRIKAGKCTPFLGAGACFGALLLGGEIAQEWTQEHDYPLEDCRDLARVAQFLSVQFDPMFPKDEILERFFKNVAPPNFKEPDEPHGVLADLPLPVYMTTNYDDFMVRALESCESWKKEPRRELFRWNSKLVKHHRSIFDSDPDFKPTPENPVVFHLHGHNKVPASLVLTEDDYLDFLVNFSSGQYQLPHWIERALTGSSLLFIGYSLADWDFRVLFRGLVTSTEPSLRRISVTVQLPPPKPAGEVHLRNGDKISGKIIEESEGSITIETKAMGLISISKEFVERVVGGGDEGEETKTKQQEYLDEYFKRIDIRAYWGTAREFAAELRQRCQKEGIL